MLWLWEVFSNYTEAVSRGDKTWWPFIFTTFVTTAAAVAVIVWVA